jgi:hypothetical protein
MIMHNNLNKYIILKKKILNEIHSKLSGYINPNYVVLISESEHYTL